GDRLMNRAAELANYAWDQLHRFPTPDTARALSILLIEGTADDFFRSRRLEPMPPPDQTVSDFGMPSRFVGQKARVMALLRSPWKILNRFRSARSTTPGNTRSAR